MSTTTKPLKYLWSGIFANGTVIDQPKNDLYSKHDPDAEWNPSAFRDLQDYQDNVCTLKIFQLDSYDHHVSVNLLTGEWFMDDKRFFMDENDINSERKLIYYRTMQRYNNDGVWDDEPVVVSFTIGYEYKDSKNKTHKRTITIDG